MSTHRAGVGRLQGVVVWTGASKDIEMILIAMVFVAIRGASTGWVTSGEVAASVVRPCRGRHGAEGGSTRAALRDAAHLAAGE